MVRGKKYQVENVVNSAKIQSVEPPFETVYYYKIKLETEKNAEIEYHEKKNEWYLLGDEKLD